MLISEHSFIKQLTERYTVLASANMDSSYEVKEDLEIGYVQIYILCNAKSAHHEAQSGPR